MTYLSDGSITVSLDISWNSAVPTNLIFSRDQTIGGKDSYTLWSSFDVWDLSVRWFPGSDAAQLNEWWRNSRTLTFVFEPETGQPTHSVKIVGGVQPFTQLEKPYNDLFSGVISLEDV